MQLCRQIVSFERKWQSLASGAGFVKQNNNCGCGCGLAIPRVNHKPNTCMTACQKLCLDAHPISGECFWTLY
ncbi:hypothetical protein IQ06DRAFT_122595 [Phaeosphaeriaceae sp. SRC1lsM3a]|nr:hypothetical protein IQ06DRAFT_122595 [Stagonospora sp. SRC1lsM3a]